MPTIPLHPPLTPDTTPTGPLPPTLRTPTGIALVELQGTLNLPASTEATDTPVGTLVFPADALTGEWNGKKVFWYVGKHQRLTGEVQKLKLPLGVLRRRGEGELAEGGAGEEIEVLEIVKSKIIFKDRPEPVGMEENA